MGRKKKWGDNVAMWEQVAAWKHGGLSFVAIAGQLAKSENRKRFGLYESPSESTVRRELCDFLAGSESRSEGPETIAGSREGPGEGEGSNPGSIPSEPHIETLKETAALLRGKCQELVPVPSSTIEIEMFRHRTTWSFTPWSVDQQLGRLDLTRSGLQAVWSHLYGHEPSFGARLDEYQQAARVGLEAVEESVNPLAPHGLGINAGAVVFKAVIDTACVALSWEGKEVNVEDLFPLAYDRATADDQNGRELFRDPASLTGAAPNGKEWDGTQITIGLSNFRVGGTRSLEEAKSAVDGLNNLLRELRKAQPITELATMYRDLRQRLQVLWDDLDPLNVELRARTGRCEMCRKEARPTP